MRGKVRRKNEAYVHEGITPAYAGKSMYECKERPLCRDHPRLCGEKVEQRNIVIDTIGSPPPMRGKVIKTDDRGHDVRITPAYAGKSLKYSGHIHRN